MHAAKGTATLLVLGSRSTVNIGCGAEYSYTPLDIYHVYQSRRSNVHLFILHTKTEQCSTRTSGASKLQRPTETKSFPALTQNQRLFWPCTTPKPISNPTQNVGHFCIHHTKPSWFQPKDWNQVNLDPILNSSQFRLPRCKIEAIAKPEHEKQATFDPHTKTETISGLHT